MADKVRVTVLGAFPLGGAIVAPGEAEVPADMVERLLAKGLIAKPEGTALKASDGGRVEAAAARIGAAYGMPYDGKEGVAFYMERLATKVEAGTTKGAPTAPEVPPAAETKKTPKGLLPEDFPGRAALKGSGITTFEQLLEIKTRADLIALKGIADKTADEIVEATNLLMKQLNEPQQ